MTPPFKKKGGERRIVVALISGLSHLCSYSESGEEEEDQKIQIQLGTEYFLSVTLFPNYPFILSSTLNLLLLKFSQVSLEMLKQVRRDIAIVLVGSIKQT